MEALQPGPFQAVKAEPCSAGCVSLLDEFLHTHLMSQPGTRITATLEHQIQHASFPHSWCDG